MGRAGGRTTLRQPVFGIRERSGRVFTEIVPDVKKKTLLGIIRGQAVLDATIVSDGWQAHDGLVDVGYGAHLPLIRYPKRPTRIAEGEVPINGIEASWSFTKRRPARFNGVSRTFGIHLKECAWRLRKDRDTLNREYPRLPV